MAAASNDDQERQCFVSWSDNILEWVKENAKFSDEFARVQVTCLVRVGVFCMLWAGTGSFGGNKENVTCFLIVLIEKENMIKTFLTMK